MINIELTDNTIEYDGYTLYQIKAINPYKHNKVYKDILGGYIDKTSIITDNAWIEKDAKVYNCCVLTGNTRIGEDGIVNNYSTVSDSIIEDKAIITNDSHIQNNSTIECGSIVDNSTVKYDSIVRGNNFIKNSIISDKSSVFFNSTVIDSKIHNTGTFGDNTIINSIISNSEIKNSVIKNNCIVDKSIVIKTIIEDNCTVSNSRFPSRPSPYKLYNCKNDKNDDPEYHICIIKDNTTILNSVILYGNIIADNSTIKDEKIKNEYIFNDTRVNYHTAKIKMMELKTDTDSAINYQYHY